MLDSGVGKENLLWGVRTNPNYPLTSSSVSLGLSHN